MKLNTKYSLKINQTYCSLAFIIFVSFHKCIKILASRFPSVKAQVHELLNQLEELLDEVTKRTLPTKIARKFEAFKELLSIVVSAIFEFYSNVK